LVAWAQHASAIGIAVADCFVGCGRKDESEDCAAVEDRIEDGFAVAQAICRAWRN
jgi:hypothetical protein